MKTIILVLTLLFCVTAIAAGQEEGECPGWPGDHKNGCHEAELHHNTSSSAPGHVLAKKASAQPVTYRYQIMTCMRALCEVQLNAAGSQGWHVVSSFPLVLGSDGLQIVYTLEQ